MSECGASAPWWAFAFSWAKLRKIRRLRGVALQFAANWSLYRADRDGSSQFVEAGEGLDAIEMIVDATGLAGTVHGPDGIAHIHTDEGE